MKSFNLIFLTCCCPFCNGDGDESWSDGTPTADLCGAAAFRDMLTFRGAATTGFGVLRLLPLYQGLELSGKRTKKTQKSQELPQVQGVSYINFRTDGHRRSAQPATDYYFEEYMMYKHTLHK